MTLQQDMFLGFHPLAYGKYPEDDPAATLREVAQIVDEGGFDHLWLADHIRLASNMVEAAEGETKIDEPLEAWTTLTYLAGATTRVRLGSEVTPVTLRHPALFAKSLSTLDQLSGGRVTLGAGTGWFRKEFESLGLPFEKRDERFAKAAEALSIMQALWTQPSVDFEGKHYQLQDAVIAPKPKQAGGIPIWFGGFSDKLFNLLLRFGSGWILGTNASVDFVRERWERLREMAQERDVDVSRMPVVVPLFAYVSEDRQRAADALERYITLGNFDEWMGNFFGEEARKHALCGTPDDVLERLEPYLQLGVRGFIFKVRTQGIMKETAELLASKVVPKLLER